MSNHTLVQNLTSAEPTLIVFGRDKAGKPRASWFDALSADLATKAADLMQMRVLKVLTDEQKSVARQHPRGRVFATGKAFTPYTRPALFSTLLDLARAAAGPTLVHSAGDDPALSRDTETKASPSQSASPISQPLLGLRRSDQRTGTAWNQEISSSGAIPSTKPGSKG